VPASRRSLTYLFIGLAVVFVALLLYRQLPNQSAATVPAGQLDQAVANYKAHSDDKANTISDDPNKQTDIQGDGQTVLYYTQDGKHYSTTVTSGTRSPRSSRRMASPITRSIPGAGATSC
jgi:hypothetical protein